MSPRAVRPPREESADEALEPDFEPIRKPHPPTRSPSVRVPGFVPAHVVMQDILLEVIDVLEQNDMVPRATAEEHRRAILTLPGRPR